MSGYQHCQVVTTTDSRDAADALARGVVTARLAACAHVTGPLTSTYWWEGRIDTAEEWQVVFKTPFERYPALERYVLAHHTYEVPEVLCTPIVAGNPAYQRWLEAQTRPVEQS